MIYKKFYVIFTIESEVLADKWLKSLRQVKDKSDDYVYNPLTNLKRYAQMEKAFNRITGKSVFKDYAVLLERFEIRTMQQIWMKSHIFMKAMFSRGVLGDANNPGATDQCKKDLLWPDNVNETELLRRMQMFKIMVNNGASNRKISGKSRQSLSFFLL